MSAGLPPGITLDDPRVRQREAPYTFFLPPTVLVEAVDIGDLVQAVFRDEAGQVERMWVEVEDAGPGLVAGRLVNAPAGMDGIAYGDPVAVPRTHVIDVRVAEERMPPEVPEVRQYWDRCLVDDCVLTGRSRVTYLYRETPDMTGPDDRDEDSGWRLRGSEAAVEEDRVAGRPARYVALGAVLNRDDRWLDLLDEPPGVAFHWSDDAGRFLRFERPDLV